MRPRRTALLAASWVATALCAAAPLASAAGPEAPHRRFPRRSWAPRRPWDTIDFPESNGVIEIDSGFVVLGGRYLRPPYRIEADDEGVRVNGQRVEFPRSRFGHGPRRRDWRFGPAARVRPLAWHLMQNAMLLECPDGSCIVLPWPMCLDTLEVLLSSGPPSERARRLGESIPVPLPMTAEQWQGLVEAFEASPELAARFGPMWEDYQQQRRERAERAAALRRQRERTTLAGKILIYAGLVASVFTIGLLVNSRIQSAAIPCAPGQWRHVDHSGRRSRLVWRMVVLLWALNALDLACTLLARQFHGFWEMNPIGRLLLDSSAGLTLFKAAFVLFSTVLLLALRRYRAAEVATWWVCLVYAVLALRWASFTSMLIS